MLKTIGLILLGVATTVALIQIPSIENFLLFGGKKDIQTETKTFALTMPTGCNPCDNSGRYGTERRNKYWEIAAAHRDIYVDSFGRYHHEISPMRPAVFISKRVIDTLFMRDCAANGIICYFGLDGKKEQLLIVQTGRTDATKIMRAETSGTNIYYDKVYCPPSCGTGDDSISTASKIIGYPKFIAEKK